MKQTGVVSVIGIDGTIAIDAAAAIAAVVENSDEESTAEVTESKDGYGELNGFAIADERERFQFTLLPSKGPGAANLNNALKALKFLPKPCKVTFTPNTASDSSAQDIYGATTWVGIYLQGARRARIRGQNTLQFTAFKPQTSSLSVDQLLTLGVTS